MGYELTSTKVTTSFALEDSDAILEKLRAMASDEKWSNYGWRDDVANAKSLDEIAYAFGITLNFVGEDGQVRLAPEFNDVYRSMCFDDMAQVVAPYMSNGVIEGVSGFGKWQCVFKDGKVLICENYS